jgi:hypothetical protein
MPGEPPNCATPYAYTTPSLVVAGASVAATAAVVVAGTTIEAPTAAALAISAIPLRHRTGADAISTPLALRLAPQGA